MPRAKRFFLPGYLYHITHRCHDRAFLLKLGYEKRRWLHWAKRSVEKFGLKILTYCLTDNHIHLLADPEDSRTVIHKSMHLIAGRVGQEYNERKGRRGAFWEDRYHATAIQSHEHLVQCMLYIDLNMVRAGVVDHPLRWPFCSHGEVVGAAPASEIVNRPNLLAAVGEGDWETFVTRYRQQLEEALSRAEVDRNEMWTKCIAVGDEAFVAGIKQKLLHRAKRRTVDQDQAATDTFFLREPHAVYGQDEPDSPLGGDNAIPWDDPTP